jgi:hypothetical protein
LTDIKVATSRFGKYFCIGLDGRRDNRHVARVLMAGEDKKKDTCLGE